MARYYECWVITVPMDGRGEDELEEPTDRLEDGLRAAVAAAQEGGLAVEMEEA